MGGARRGTKRKEGFRGLGTLRAARPSSRAPALGPGGVGKGGWHDPRPIPASCVARPVAAEASFFTGPTKSFGGLREGLVGTPLSRSRRQCLAGPEVSGGRRPCGPGGRRSPRGALLARRSSPPPRPLGRNWGGKHAPGAFFRCRNALCRGSCPVGCPHCVPGAPAPLPPPRVFFFPSPWTKSSAQCAGRSSGSPLTALLSESFHEPGGHERGSGRAHSEGVGGGTLGSLCRGKKKQNLKWVFSPAFASPQDRLPERLRAPLLRRLQ